MSDQFCEWSPPTQMVFKTSCFNPLLKNVSHVCMKILILMCYETCYHIDSCRKLVWWGKVLNIVRL